MQSLAFYLLKVIACSGILLLYYRLALRNKRFHYYNRFYLLATVAASILLPLLQVNWFTFSSSSDKAIALLNVIYVQGDEITVHAKAGFAVNWQQAPLLVYSLVSIFFIALLIWRVRKIYSFKKRYSATSMGEFDFINTDLSQAPFSFLQNLFWRTDIDLNETTGRQILQHELTHIRQKHTWDKLWMQIILSVLWINPFYWFIQKELYLLHEFIADEKAIENNDGAAFATMLLTSQYGKSIFSPAQSFAYSPIKRRLYMLTNLTKPRYSYARRLMVLPLLAAVMMLFAFRVQKAGNTGEKNITAQTETPVSITTGNDSDINGITITDSIAKNSKSKPGEISITDTATPAVIVSDKSITLHYNNGDTAGSSLKALIVIDGKVCAADELNNLNPGTIESVRVLKGGSAIDKYGAPGADGVIEIDTKKYAMVSGIEVQNVILSDTNSEKKLRLVLRGYPDTGRNAAIVLKGYPLKREHSISDSEIVVTGYPSKTTRRYPANEITVQGYAIVSEQAHFPGGEEAWKNYLQKTLRAGVPAKKGAPKGNYTVVVSFMVDEDGNISEVRADKDPGFGTAAEAIRVIQQGPNWVPAKQKDKTVKYRQRQVITFAVE